MYQSSAILSLQIDSQAAIAQSLRRLDQAGFQVMRSFDLKVARTAHVGCSCPHHGTDLCDCQMVVLLVYGQGEKPVTLIVHGHDGQTQISLVDTPDQTTSEETIQAIMALLQPAAHP